MRNVDRDIVKQIIWDVGVESRSNGVKLATLAPFPRTSAAGNLRSSINARLPDNLLCSFDFVYNFADSVCGPFCFCWTHDSAWSRVSVYPSVGDRLDLFAMLRTASRALLNMFSWK